MINYNKDTEWIKGYRYKLYPTDEQKQFIENCINTNRYVYNWALSKELEAYEKGEPFISEFSLNKMLTIHRNETPWLKEIPNTTCRSGIIDCMNAYNKFFKKIANKPTFKKKGKERKQSFHTRNDRVYFKDTKIKIEGCDPIETKFDLESTFKDKKIHQPVVSKDKLGDYYISFLVVEEKPIIKINNNYKEQSEVIGIDLNKHNYFACSDGTIYKAPEEKIKRLQKGISDAQSKCAKDRKRHNELEKVNPDIEIPMSKRSQKRRTRYLKRNKKLTNVVNNTIGFITKDIAIKNPKGVIMENLDVDSIKKNNKHVAREINHYAFGKCKEVMKKKCDKYNIPFKLAPKDYPSSQLCSNCGNKIEIDRHRKNYECPICGYKENRDINAAKNLAKIFDEI